MSEQTAPSLATGVAEPYLTAGPEAERAHAPGRVGPAWPRDTAARPGDAGPGEPAFPGQEGPGRRAYVTARGAMIGMLALFLMCDLVAAWIHVEVLIGLGYVGACAITPYLVRRHALLQVVAAPPALFLAALLVAQALTAQGSSRHGKVLSVLEGTLLTLAAIAPWLLAGTALGVCTGLRKGLRQCLRDLLAELRAARQPGPSRRAG
jgi:hypothetical protein